ncbi:MAG: hypothetical protein E1N59_641 [Puniceicoccaceae bacterium 5H]|nr:MAG: hypothetical protein E1N59_641 [Puniceicoccaceae bacterium 5H]
MDVQTQLIQATIWILLAIVAVAGAGFMLFRGSLGAKNVKVSPVLESQLFELIAEGRKIEAIRKLRASTGMSLRDAKTYVDRMSSGAAPTGDLTPETQAEAERLIASGHKAAAVKLVREQTGRSLKEAQKTVDRLARG